MSVQTSDAHAVATSPLGPITLVVSGLSGISVGVAAIDVPQLPQGMAVDGVMLFSVHLPSPVTEGSPIHLRLSAHRDGSPESGQWLESMAFETANGVLQLATRDNEWLAAKGIAADFVRYERQGFSQMISEAPAGTILYASVAWREATSAGSNDSATWFAADLALPS